MQGSTFKRAEELAGHVREYVNTRFQSAKLAAAEKGVRMGARAMARSVIMAMLLISFTFLSVAGALALSRWLGDYVWGFLVMGSFYLVATLFLWINRERWLYLPFMNRMLRELFKEEPEDEEN